MSLRARDHPVRSPTARDRADRATGDADASPDDGASLPPVGIERPANPDHGDWATQRGHAARACGSARRRCRIAEALPRALRATRLGGGAVGRGAGLPQLPPRSGLGRCPGRPHPRRRPGVRPRSAASGRRINVEFVSANPTGPLTRRQRPWRVRRRRAVAASWRRRATTSRASTTSTTSTSQVRNARADRSGRSGRTSRSPRTAIAATT